MGLNFRKSISLGKGLKLNLSKSGPSVSFGKSGFRQSINLKGNARTTVGIPGTGIYYTKNTNVKNVVSSLTGKAQDAKNKKAAGKAAAEPKAAKSTKAAAAGAAGAAVGAKAAAKPAVNRSKNLQQESKRLSPFISSLTVTSTGKLSQTVLYQASSRSSSLSHRAFWQAT